MIIFWCIICRISDKVRRPSFSYCGFAKVGVATLDFFLDCRVDLLLPLLHILVFLTIFTLLTFKNSKYWYGVVENVSQETVFKSWFFEPANR